MKFGVGVPTGTEGLMYPVPYASIEEAVELTVISEELGFDSVWGNDHIATQRYVQDHFPTPPNFFDPLGYLAFCAAKTKTIRLATCILVLPFRHPVVAAKQLATLDHLSNGRLVVGMGIGAYREEFEALHPGVDLHRGRYAEEAIASLHLLFSERRASFDGEFIQFDNVESYPKPRQQRLPLLSGGNAPGSKDRAGRLADGWLPAILTPDEVAAGMVDVERAAASVGRLLPSTFELAVQVGVSIGSTPAEAERRFDGSQVSTHINTLAASTLKDQPLGNPSERNLIGTPDEIAAQIDRYAAVGVDCLAGLLFAADTMDETIAQMTMFRDEVMVRYQ